MGKGQGAGCRAGGGAEGGPSGIGTSLHAGRCVHMLRVGSRHLNSDPWSSAQRPAVLVVPDNEMLTCPSGLALLHRLGVASEDPSKTRFFRAGSCTSCSWLPELPS